MSAAQCGWHISSRTSCSDLLTSSQEQKIDAEDTTGRGSVTIKVSSCFFTITYSIKLLKVHFWNIVFQSSPWLRNVMCEEWFFFFSPYGYHYAKWRPDLVTRTSMVHTALLDFLRHCSVSAGGHWGLECLTTQAGWSLESSIKKLPSHEESGEEMYGWGETEEQFKSRQGAVCEQGNPWTCWSVQCSMQPDCDTVHFLSWATK